MIILDILIFYWTNHYFILNELYSLFHPLGLISNILIFDLLWSKIYMQTPYQTDEICFEISLNNKQENEFEQYSLIRK